MKAVQFKFGGNHSIVDLPKPTPAKDEVLIKVTYSALDTAHSACLNKEMMGYFVRSLKEPMYLGYHYSGTVEAIGSDVSDLVAKGTDVFGFLQYEPSQTQGAFAEYVVVKRKDCAIKPNGISHQIAAASTTESVTALQAIRDLGGLEQGQSILIVGAAGGVGSAAVQISKLLGAHVTAVCSSGDIAQVKDWGADRVLDRSKDQEDDYFKKLIKEGERFNVIFDVPNMLSSSATSLLKPHGAIVNTVPTLAFIWGKLKTLFSSKKVYIVECHSDEKDIELVGKWLDEGELKIPIDSTFKVREMEAAMVKQGGRKKGRVLVQVENGWN